MPSPRPLYLGSGTCLASRGGPEGRDRPLTLWPAEAVGELGRPAHPLTQPEQLPGPPSPYLQGRARVGSLSAEGGMAAAEVFVGIDVSKAHLDVAVRPGGDTWRVPNTEGGIAGLLERLRTLSPALVLLEATGGLEVPLVGALGAAGLPTVVSNPRQVRDFAKAVGRLAKTDALDAAVLAHFAET